MTEKIKSEKSEDFSDPKNLREFLRFKDWQKLDLRVAKILEVKQHPNADKLYIINVDLGGEKRELVAGLKQHYTPEKLKGKLCVVFCNLEPAIIRGVKSEGMILAAVSEDEKHVKIISPAGNIELGSKIR